MKLAIAEPLELCLAKSIISEKHYRAGILYRILFTKIFGLPHACAYDLTRVNGVEVGSLEKQLALVDIEELYRNTDKALIKDGAKNAIANICVYERYPKFLLLARSQWHTSKELVTFKQGMKILKKQLL